MRKVIVSNAVSLDGFFEGPNKELDWFVVEEEFFDFARNQLLEVDTILFGRVTYEMMSGYWPNATDNDPVITDKMNSLQYHYTSELRFLRLKDSRIQNHIILKSKKS